MYFVWLRSQPHPLSFKLLFENTVLFDERVDDRLLVAVKLTGQGDHEEVEGLYNMSQCTIRLAVILPDNNIIRLVRTLAPYAGKPAGITHYLIASDILRLPD